MRKWLVTAVALAISFVSIRADVTLTQTMTMEGAAAAAMGGAQLPRITMRIKGQKSRADIEMNGQTVTSITDLAARQVITLNAATKTATITTPESVAAGGDPLVVPNLSMTFKATGQTRAIEGQQCEEHQFTMKMSMAEMMGGQLPPEAATMMQDVTMMMEGSMWVAPAAPGAAEFTAFKKAAVESKLLSAITGMPAGKSGGLDKVMEAAAKLPGVPYLTDISMSFEGTGPVVEVMKQMGAVKMIQKMSNVSTDAIPDEMFRVPEGYTVEKK